MNEPSSKTYPKLAALAIHILTAAVCMGSALSSKSEALAQTQQRLDATIAREMDFSRVDRVLSEAVQEGRVPGAVVLVGHHGRVVYRKAFGFRSLEPQRERMTVDTIFDLASLTKCVVTTTAIMQLVERGQIRLKDPVAVYLPQFASNGKQDVTVRELLTHFSGLAPDLDLKQSWSGKSAAMQLIEEQVPTDPPGAKFVYSDINFETLGAIVEKVSGQALDVYAKEHIFSVLHMLDTGYVPPRSVLPRVAPTEYDEKGNMLRGIVHDPTARRMGGIAGHAGLFSTADDLSNFAEDLLWKHRVLGRLAVEKMSTPQQPANASSLRGLGWDIDSPFAGNRGELLPVGSYGHTGFTGTSLWLDPSTDTYIILLTNAVHPHAGKSIVSLRARVSTAVAASLKLTLTETEKIHLARLTGYNEAMVAERRFTVRNGQVKNGIDVLEEHQFSELAPSVARPVRLGLITNQTGIDRKGRRTAEVLANVPGLRLTAIFSPEHGVDGTLDTQSIVDGKDKSTGVPIFSVYGSSEDKRRPTYEQLKNVDVLVFDIQDVGVRFYTYESTLGYFLEASARFRKKMVVLDRPNPVNGSYVQGPVADEGSESFVSYWRTPIRHGMTLGELARMFNVERKIDADLEVVAMTGWQRGDWFDSTGQLWINPSPNMRSLAEAQLYSATGLIETTNVSVGRGTDTPFELVGAPWIDAVSLSSYLNAREISGVRFVPVRFVPGASVHSGQRCEGVSILVTDRDSLDGPELGLEIAAALLHLYPNTYSVDGLHTLMRNKAALAALKTGQDPRRIADDWREDKAKFLGVRSKHLLY